MSSGGNARFITNAGGEFDISQLTTAGTTAGSIEGAGSYILGSNWLTVGGNNLSTEVSGIISGTGGALTKVGSGTLTLSGTNTYTGGTTVNVGTLVLGNGGASGSIVGDVVDNATFAINRSDSYTFGGNISGTGAFEQHGTGTTIFTGTDTYTGGTTISGGTLLLGDGGTSGSIVGNVVDNGTLAINRSDGYLFDGVISGTGAFEQRGTGATFLTGINTYTGATAVEAGALIVDGSIAASSLLTVDAGALVGGTGILPSTIISGGMLSPGQSIGTITIQGNLTMTTAAAYLVEMSPSAADRTDVSGTATLHGTVQVFAGAGHYAPGVTFTILTATGGITGTFDSLTTNFAPMTFLAPKLTYDAHDVYFTLGRNGVSFASVGHTANEVAVGAAVDSLTFGNAVFDAVVQGTADTARMAFDALSGEVHASTRGVLIEDARTISQSVLGRLRQASFGDTAGEMAALAVGGPELAYADTAMAADFPIKAPARKAHSPGPDLTFWTEAIGAWGHLDGDGNAAEVKRTLGGFVSGFDRRLGEGWRAGLAGGYTHSQINDNARSSSAGVDTAQFAAYLGGELGAFNLRAGAAIAWNQIDSSRTVAFPGFFENIKAQYRSGAGQLFGEVGYATSLGRVALEPFAGLAWVHLHTDAFTETGGAAALASAAADEDVGFSSLGLRAATLQRLGDGLALIPRATLAWEHAFGDVVPQATLAFASGSAQFTVAGAPLARDAARVEAGLDLRSRHDTLSVTYSGRLATNAQDHAVSGKLTHTF